MVLALVHISTKSVSYLSGFFAAKRQLRGVAVKCERKFNEQLLSVRNIIV